MSHGDVPRYGMMCSVKSKRGCRQSAARSTREGAPRECFIDGRDNLKVVLDKQTLMMYLRLLSHSAHLHRHSTEPGPRAGSLPSGFHSVRLTPTVKSKTAQLVSQGLNLRCQVYASVRHTAVEIISLFRSDTHSAHIMIVKLILRRTMRNSQLLQL